MKINEVHKTYIYIFPYNNLYMFFKTRADKQTVNPLPSQNTCKTPVKVTANLLVIVHLVYTEAHLINL